ncbi:MAG: thiol-disulfide oxidoreductase DCC family protein [Parvibaculales bacterium]
MEKLTVYYNGSCTICGPEVQYYQKLSETHNRDIKFIDISTACPTNLNQDAMLRSFHVETENGTMHQGLDAFLALWAQLPKFRYLAQVLRLPILKQVAAVVYTYILAPWLYHRFMKNSKI